MKAQNMTWDALLVLGLILAFSFSLVWSLFPFFMKLVMPISDMMMTVAAQSQSDLFFVFFTLIHIVVVMSYLVLLPFRIAQVIVDKILMKKNDI
ncbi:hypothetical protein [Acinetobacter venetianus]|uniref:hypothetical protein n=1 Tax=Acinetobacter venetianus TaxID=52133 RepID=UPI0010236154|nr:hypothetical protein [Acinetobacter venetianus]RZG79643.1 hypothetical protein EXE23_13360 [Acinetobacter venetianus]